jgi:hypothetical protein
MFGLAAFGMTCLAGIVLVPIVRKAMREDQVGDRREGPKS